ncbi:MAG: hypothetical protein UY76_C0043G0001 [Candidatus Uhrbacteria bacterium GW2011_GWA2_52_8d]|uniref:Baseplate protein J-like barrel domain-containing protein n=1 Tax=Candidatus Uhrbacteria bacterium GW2011_GWA2_52_8d TaxID=1618979 RepID=A0A0G1XMD4_9BACT|nr:MAG: hypothetical protein UY76_C0043G0001 [Candidatus Uhrbacteria bacterium GW2011_GWA2_52_8d]
MSTKKVVPKKRVAVRKGGAKKITVTDIEDLEITQPAAVPLIMYRRIALTFIVLVAAALLAVLYLSIVQAVIHVDSTEEPITTEFVANVYEVPTRTTDVRGAVVSGTLGRTQTFEPTGESAKTVEDIARGTVTIYNNLTFAQSLVATTRFLTESGVLFRLESAVTVPAGGSVDAQVYADVAGESGNIAPTRFSIPGLSAVRQESVYATSAEAFTGGVYSVAVVSQTELDMAASELELSLLEDAKAMLVAEVGETFTGQSYDVEVVDKTFSIEPDTEAQSFDVVLTLKVTAVFFDQEALGKIAVAKLYEGLGQGQEFLNVDASNMVVTVEAVDEEAGQANILVSLAVPAITSRTSEALQVGRFVGMSQDEVRELLVGEGVATDVTVEFFPFWVSTVPRLKDHIYIDIQ